MTTSFQSIGKERVQTPAGTFDCIKVYSVVNGATGQPSPVSISYYADGIGPVRQIMQMGGQQIIATLVSTNVKSNPGTPAATKPPAAAKPPQETQAAPKSPAAEKIRCPKCGAQVDANAKFCPECGQRIAASAPAAEPNRPAAHRLGRPAPPWSNINRPTARSCSTSRRAGTSLKVTCSARAPTA